MSISSANIRRAVENELKAREKTIDVNKAAEWWSENGSLWNTTGDCSRL